MATKKREVFLLKNKIIDGEPCGPDYETSTATVEATLADWWCESGTACDPKSADAKKAKADRADAKKAAEADKVQNRDPKAENRDPK